MKLTVPFEYEFWYVPVRCINDREAFAAATVDVDIREFDDADAPVVMTVANKNVSGTLSRGYSRFLPKADGGARRVRMRDGYFYVEGFGAEELIERASNVATLNSTFLSWVGPHDKSPGVTKGVSRTITTVRELRWNRNLGGLREDKTRDDGGAKTGSKIAAQAAKMFVVDGTTYERCQEPVLAIIMNSEKEPYYGIVEADESIRTRADVGKYDNATAWTSSLVHADHVIEVTGVDPSVVQFEVIDQTASSYDGVSADVITALARARETLKEAIKAAPSATLQAFYKVREALENVDFASPSVSPEIIAAAHSILDAVVDPDIDEPMQELANARYMNYTSNRPRATGNPNEGGPFVIGLDHVSNYRDMIGYSSRARHFAERAIERWESRHPQSTFDNGQTHRMTSRGDDGLIVAEIGTDSQARRAARELNVAYAEVDKAIGEGSRIFRVSVEKEVGDLYSKKLRSEAVGLVVGPPAGGPDASWRVLALGHEKANSALQAVGEHIQAMDELDAEIKQDQQLISIF
jgi:hypothetical protein